MGQEEGGSNTAPPPRLPLTSLLSITYSNVIVNRDSTYNILEGEVGLSASISNELYIR